MKTGLVIAWILGLVLQLVPASALVAAERVGGPLVSNACGCCDGDSCPCAEPGGFEHDTLPVQIPGANPVKIPAVKVTADVSLVFQHSAPPVVARTPLHPGPAPGYAGVALAVAFCSFVI